MEVTVQQQAQPSLMRDMVMLTKPRIISLLLVTTIAPMFVAGNPGWLLCVVVLVGGYLMAGGANAVNMYLDRDIDTQMARTRLRPIRGRWGRGRMSLNPRSLPPPRFCCAIPRVSGSLACRFYFYSSSTRVAPRTTPRTCHCEPGAFPPLSGAAMTGTSTSPRLPFDRVYGRTAFGRGALKQRDYGQAGVPMAPLVWGERETMRQMMWYNVILIALTLLPAAFGAFGIIYFVSAAVLGAILLVGVIRVSTSAEWTKPAWSVYKFSLLYLALLFVAMVVDRKVLG